MRPGSVTKSLLMIAFLAAVSLPGPVDAKAGGGHSSGSRGSHTYESSPSGAQPVQRSTAPQTAPQPAPSPPYQPRPPVYAPQPVRHPFLRGLAGGLIGMSIAHMLFGSGGFGMTGGGGPGLLHFLLIGLAVWFGYRLIRSLMNRNGGSMPLFQQPGGFPLGSAQTRPVSQPLMLTEEDRNAFGQAFLAIQSAWSDRDFSRLQRYMTPEMVSYFNEELSANISRGLVNRVEQVQVQNINQVEAWQENGLAYATVVIKWTARDYMVRADRTPADPDYAATPSSSLAALDQEQWTFVRSQGGHWLLSAIQQM